MNILFLQKRVLFPCDTGWKVRTLNVVRYLARWHDVTYLCNVVPGEEPRVAEMRDLGLDVQTVPWRDTPRDSLAFYAKLAANLLSPHPYHVNKDHDPPLRRRAEELLAQRKYDLVVCDFVHMARNAIGLGPMPSLLFQHNVEAQLLDRYADGQHGLLSRAMLRVQARKMRRFEGWAGDQFDAVVAISANDLALYQQWYGWKHAQVIDTAVDVDQLAPSGRPEVAERLAFVGSLDWPANADGVKWFVAQVWPKIRQARPTAKLHLVGRNPPSDVKALAETPGVSVFGNVPDVRPYLEEAEIIVVPLLVGGGTRLKIVEAMGNARAIVSTSLGAEGLPVEPGRHLMLADAPDEFAQAVLDLLSDAPRRRALGQAARQHMCAHYSAETVARQFERICQDAVDAGRARLGKRAASSTVTEPLAT